MASRTEESAPAPAAATPAPLSLLRVRGGRATQREETDEQLAAQEAAVAAGAEPKSALPPPVLRDAFRVYNEHMATSGALDDWIEKLKDAEDKAKASSSAADTEAVRKLQIQFIKDTKDEAPLWRLMVERVREIIERADEDGNHGLERAARAYLTEVIEMKDRGILKF